MGQGSADAAQYETRARHSACCEPQVQNYADDEAQTVKRYSEGGRRKLI